MLIFRKIVYHCIIIGVVFCCVSCEKFVDILPVDRSTGVDVFKDSTNATSAVLGIYIDMVQDAQLPKLLSGGVSIFTALSSDELDPNGAPANSIQFYKNAISPSNNFNLTNLWKAGYQTIFKTNACIEGLTKSSLSPGLRDQLIAECRFVRAFTYYLLINLYGDVPYIKTTDFNQTSIMARTSSSQIISDIQKELDDCKLKMSIDYPSPGKQRPNRIAAQALLSRIYLSQKDWLSAEKETTEILNAPGYIIEGDLNRVFSQGSSEVIWQIDPIVKEYETAEGWFLVPTSKTAVPKYTLSKDLYSQFSADDKRKSAWINTNKVTKNGVTTEYHYPAKYKFGRDNWIDKPIESYCYFRLAEVILIRAEARINAGKFTGAGSGISDINLIRFRAGLPDTLATSKEEALEILLQEKRVEMFCEWGTRWFDLKRLGIVDNVMEKTAAIKGTTWNSNWRLYPIPFQEIQSNPFLIQNNGYPEQ